MSKLFSLLELIRLADSLPRSVEQLIATSPSSTIGLPLLVGPNDTQIGIIRPSILEHISQYGTVFQIGPTAVRLNPDLDTPQARTDAVEAVLRQLQTVDDPELVCLKGWRNERYDVHGDRKKEEGILMELERAAAGVLGVRSYGCHMNGYQRDPQTGEMKMWIARRSKTKQTYPGMLDNLVGGGLAAGVDPLSNIIKECWEEAGLDGAMVAKNIVNVGAVTFYLVNEERGWIPTTEYVYDLDVGNSFMPKAVDGEVQGFQLLNVDELKEHLYSGEFTPEAGLVVIDFLIRHGFVTAMNEPDYIDILSGMHRELVSPGPQYGL
ncbi:uncharacterized protein SPPG_05414 [Spizellomyces punctatus DAOM BR117]|uniref:Nudix hydrolase domain-containing protein n=1 Tax=Spizellomyces punctatus (strain DAOM BR117) TaxID=645134 RepID=A0A0L0HDF1_SPIPD|nr:uncharacterized protein SPPG_05414 [Spizellomyces punctatus DAOM BR117]KNC99157.1 hypothetical protein SPPG_05414 [Spizellomyces punctatus DAOM BR117]|eukprot:XP_016607197.1 hypothetical protein SPPG_05414 [Spizellomyces punctatus DAOM BR117]